MLDTVYTNSQDSSSNLHNTQDAHEHLRTQWRQVVGILANRGAGFVLIDRGSKGTGLRKGWQKNPASAAEALRHLDAGGNVGLLAGTGAPMRLYAFDMDVDAERGYECAQLGGTLTIARENAPGRAKFIFACADELPARKDRGAPVELLAIASTGGFGNVVIAGMHKSGAPILWAGHTIAQLDRDTVAALWGEWTGKELFPTYTPREHSEPAPELATVAEALGYVDPWALPYDGQAASWIGVLAALKHDYGDAALDLAVEWAEGKLGEVEAKWPTFGAVARPATVRTIYKLALDAGWTPPQPPDAAQLQEALLHRRGWLRTADAAETFKDHGLRYTTGRKLMDALYELCASWRREDIRPGSREWALRAGVGRGTLQRAAPKLQAAGLLMIALPEGAAAYTEAATIHVNVVYQNGSTAFQGDDTSGSVLINYSDHRCDDAYRNNHAAYKRKHPDGLAPLGEAALAPHSELLAGPATVAELSAQLGASAQSVRRGLQREYGYGLVTYTTGRHNTRLYAVAEGCEDDLNVLRRNMTTDGVQMRRALQSALDKLQAAIASGNQRRIDAALVPYNRAAAAGGWRGADPAQWVGAKRGRWLRWDIGEMAADDAQLRGEVQALQAAGLPPADIRRMLGLAGYADADVSRALTGRGVTPMAAQEVAPLQADVANTKEMAALFRAGERDAQRRYSAERRISASDAAEFALWVQERAVAA